MPTSYTSKLMEKGQLFPDFVMRCARAFGPCSSLVDLPLDKPIPETVGHDSYHEERLAKAKPSLEAMQAMSHDEREALGKKERQAHIRMLRSIMQRNEREDRRLREMAEQVAKWEPPTKDHAELKNFMLQQIHISYHNAGEYYKREIEQAQQRTPMEFYEIALSDKLRDVKYHQEQLDKNNGRFEFANKWLRELRNSLANHDG